MQATGISWAPTEKTIAKAALDCAYERETAALLQEVQDRAKNVLCLDDLWQLHDFLSARRHDIEGKYEEDCSSLLFGLARLVKEGWLTGEELTGLSPDKRSKVSALARM
ncbi:MAG: hypothetical protein B0A82_22745 [Alkalinema sp. CACIAM 70d]|nr:MAG: hypothetical protein B0A82_22745 [Alkalinema sp. CACIAM 70d]